MIYTNETTTQFTSAIQDLIVAHFFPAVAGEGDLPVIYRRRILERAAWLGYDISAPLAELQDYCATIDIAPLTLNSIDHRRKALSALDENPAFAGSDRLSDFNFKIACLQDAIYTLENL